MNKGIQNKRSMQEINTSKKHIEKTKKKIKWINYIGIIITVPMIMLLSFQLFLKIQKSQTEPSTYPNTSELSTLDEYTDYRSLYLEVPKRVLLTKEKTNLITPSSYFTYVKYDSNLGKQLRTKYHIKADMTGLKLYRTKYDTWGYKIDKSIKYKYYTKAQMKEQEKLNNKKDSKQHQKNKPYWVLSIIGASIIGLVYIYEWVLIFKCMDKYFLITENIVEPVGVIAKQNIAIFSIFIINIVMGIIFHTGFLD